MIPRTLSPRLDLLKREYVLVQAWKKTAAYIRRHNWFSDTLDLDLTAVDLANFLQQISDEVQYPHVWKNAPLRLVLAPKSQDWWVRPEQEATGRWQPRPTDAGTLADVSDKLRPLAHVALRDQVVATALMLCLANRVETRQRDPRPAARRKERLASGTVPFMSYGNRLFCDSEAGELRHRWGSTKLYRGYYQDYREFLSRTRRAAEDATGRQTFVVQADLSKFYDRVRPSTLSAAVRALQKPGDDEDFFALADSVLDWEWHPDDRAAVDRYAEAGDRPLSDFDRLALPQGLVSAGFWSNVVLLDFDEAVRTRGAELFGLQLVYANRYVDDVRLVVTTAGKEGDAGTPETTADQVKEAVVAWLNGLLSDCAHGLELNEGKTEVVEFGADRTGTVLQSQRMNRIQERVSGGFTATEGLELLESIQGLLMIRSGFTRDEDESRWELAPESEVPEDTRARFGAFRYRRVLRDIRAMLPDDSDVGSAGVRVGPGMSVVTRQELDQLTRAFALVLVEKWVNDPSNVRILLVALDLWPDAELLEKVLKLLRPWMNSNMGLPDAQRVAWYCLSEIFRAGATETGLNGDQESRPEGLRLDDYRRVLIAEAWAAVKQAEPVLPWYLRQQALLLLIASQSYSARLHETLVEDDPPHYRQIAGVLGANTERLSPDLLARHAIVLHQCFQRQAPGANWTVGNVEAAAKLDPAFAAELLRQRDGSLEDTWGPPAQQLLVNSEALRPDSLARLALDGELHRDELTLLRLVRLLIEAIDEPANEAAPPWRITLNQPEEHEKARRSSDKGARFPWESASFHDAGPADEFGLWHPPDFSSEDQWRYQIGFLLRFALSRRPDFTTNVRRPRPKEDRRYRSASSTWLQRRYGNYDGQSAFGGDWLPISDWLERFLSALLWWPGRRHDDYTRTVDRGMEATRDLVEDRIQRLEKLVGKATEVQLLPMGFSSSYLSKGLKTLRGCVVQTTYPAESDFRDDLTLSSADARALHRDHLTNALALVRQNLRLRHRARPNRSPGLDLLVLPELSVHPDDVNRYLKPFARAYKTMILAGMVFEPLPPETEELVNTAVWIIPEYSVANGWNVRSRRQGKGYLAAHERGRRHEGRPIRDYRPCQWIIECPASLASVEPLRLSASVCYDATDLAIAADLRDRSDVYVVPALNKDVQTYDNVTLALSYQMYQLVVVANNGRYGGSSAYWPIGKPHERRIMHLHGQNQPTLGFFRIKDVVEYRRGRVEHLDARYQWKTPPAGFKKK
ncbi:MAG: RNA-directed DNA polymerase [Acidobacteria bacterium]|nr:RNA-directed DNA polymerase [Acidobacteriota bacterium]